MGRLISTKSPATTTHNNTHSSLMIGIDFCYKVHAYAITKVVPSHCGTAIVKECGPGLLSIIDQTSAVRKAELKSLSCGVGCDSDGYDLGKVQEIVIDRRQARVARVPADLASRWRRMESGC